MVDWMFLPQNFGPVSRYLRGETGSETGSETRSERGGETGSETSHLVKLNYLIFLFLCRFFSKR